MGGTPREREERNREEKDRGIETDRGRGRGRGRECGGTRRGCEIGVAAAEGVEQRGPPPV